MTTTLTVAGMTCGHCKATVEKALLEVDGVDQATVDLDSGVVSVAHSDQVQVETLTSAVGSAGYMVTEIG